MIPTDQQDKNRVSLCRRLATLEHERERGARHADAGHFRIEHRPHGGVKHCFHGGGPASVWAHLLAVLGLKDCNDVGATDSGRITCIAITLGIPRDCASRLYWGGFPEGDEPEDVEPARVAAYLEEPRDT